MKYSLFFMTLLAFMSLISCGKTDHSKVDKPDENTDTPAKVNTPPANTSPAKAAENAPQTSGTEQNETPVALNMEQVELQNKMRGYSGNISSVTPLTVDQIKSLLPKTLAGLFVYENEGETSAALGSPATFVVVIYRENYNIIKIAITDTGGSPSVVLAAAQWSNQNINRNSEKGFDRITTYKDHPAREKYNNQTKVGVFEYIIDHRYVISCQGKNLTIDQMKQAMDELNLERLRNLKPISQ